MEVRVQGDGLSVHIDKTDQGTPIRDFLSTSLSLPPGFVTHLFQEGLVSIQGHRATPGEVLVAGQRIRLEGGVEADEGTLSTFGLNTTWGSFALDVLYEDEHVLVVNKPAGLIMYPGDAEESNTLLHRVAAYYLSTGQNRKVLHIHRLDKGTTGAVLYAKHAFAARALDTSLVHRAIHREYLALIWGKIRPPEGAITLPISRDRHVSGRYRASASGKPARTLYRTLDVVHFEENDVSLLQCTLETGRTHQIRVHLSSIGGPILGDVVYGGGKGIGEVEWDDGLALHARTLSFVHPYEGVEIVVQAPLPSAFAKTMAALGMRA